MIRVLFEELLPLVLPTVLYLLWWLIIGRNRKAAAAGAKAWYDGPWFWLILAGVALSGAVLVVGALRTGGDPTGTFVAPRYEGGRIVPGHIETPR